MVGEEREQKRVEAEAEAKAETTETMPPVILTMGKSRVPE